MAHETVRMASAPIQTDGTNLLKQEMLTAGSAPLFHTQVYQKRCTCIVCPHAVCGYRGLWGILLLLLAITLLVLLITNLLVLLKVIPRRIIIALVELLIFRSAQTSHDLLRYQ